MRPTAGEEAAALVPRGAQHSDQSEDSAPGGMHAAGWAACLPTACLPAAAERFWGSGVLCALGSSICFALAGVFVKARA